MAIIVVGNIISLIGCTMMFLIGFIKTKKNILIAQNIQFLIMAISNFLLGGITGVVSNCVSIIRNLVTIKWNLNWPLKIFFIAFQFVFTLITNNMGIWGWLPFISVTLFTIFLDTKNEIVLKIAIILGLICWIIYDYLVMNYAACAFDVFSIISNFIGIFMVKKNKDKSQQGS